MPFRAREDDRGQRGPVERAFRTEDRVAELGDHGGQPVGARGDHLTGGHVGVEDQRAAPGEQPGGGGLARADASGQSHQDGACLTHGGDPTGWADGC
jgi:hypothetical protein